MTPSSAIEKLSEAGLSEAAIARLVGVRQSTVNRIRRGREPRWSLGQALVALAQPGKRTRCNRTR